MKKRVVRLVQQIITYLPLAAIIISAAFLNLNPFERQYLMLILIIWTNIFFLFRVFLGQ